MNKERLWTKDFIFVSVINFFVILIFYLLMVTIAPYAVHKFQASTSVAGLVSGIFIIGALIGRLVTGSRIGYLGSKKTLLIGVMLFIIATALYFVAMNLSLLLIIRLLHGIALGVASTATGTIVAQIIPSTRRGEGIGYFSLSAVLATAIGPFVGILFTQYGDFKIMFLFNILLAVICLVIAFMVGVTDHKSSSKDEQQAVKGFNLSNYLELKAIPISFVALVIGFSYSGVMSFLSFYSEKIDLVKAGGFFFLVYAIMILLSRPFTGQLMDAKGANIVIYPCLVIFSIGMLLFSQAHNSMIFLVAGALMGLGYGNFNSVAQTIAIKVTPPQRLGLATSTYFILFDIGLGAGPYLLGFIVPITGYRGLFLTMVFVILVSIILYYFLHGRKEKAQNQNKDNNTALQGN